MVRANPLTVDFAHERKPHDSVPVCRMFLETRPRTATATKSALKSVNERVDVGRCLYLTNNNAHVGTYSPSASLGLFNEFFYQNSSKSQLDRHRLRAPR